MKGFAVAGQVLCFIILSGVFRPRLNINLTSPTDLNFHKNRMAANRTIFGELQRSLRTVDGYRNTLPAIRTLNGMRFDIIHTCRRTARTKRFKGWIMFLIQRKVASDIYRRAEAEWYAN